MKIYISTPINGRKEATFEEKREAARKRVEELKALAMKLAPGKGDSAISTFDINPDGVTEGEAMAQCIRTIIDECDAVLMDDGWGLSRGCTIEFHTAKAYGKIAFNVRSLWRWPYYYADVLFAPREIRKEAKMMSISTRR